MSEISKKAQTTRECNKAARAAREAKAREDTALVLDVIRDALKDKTATTAQRLFAVAVLDRMWYYNFVPNDARHLLQTADMAKADAEIAERLERIKNK